MQTVRKTSGMMDVARLAVFLIALPLGAITAQAGSITTPSLNDIYGQAAFGTTTPITINWLAPGTTIVSSALATIDSDAEVTTLFGMAPDASPVVNAFFVDAINFCGSALSNIVGCANQPGNVLMVDSTFAAGAQGAIDLAHELGHNLNLAHVGTETSTGNLMNPVLNSSILTTEQVTAILASSLVQTGTSGRFIDIRPIAVVSAVPEPETHLLLMAGLLVVIAARRRAAR